MTQLQQAKEQCDKLLTLLIQVDDNEELVDELAQRLAQAIRMKRSYAAMEANATFDNWHNHQRRVSSCHRCSLFW